MPIDILFGSDRLRDGMASGGPRNVDDVTALVDFDTNAWGRRVSSVSLYP
jgi:hypothetical protein